ncbi:MAG: DUF3253 domain-containing protein [Paracoccaceae bacterium]|nr:DUF3253 domain-containing protein [Paracoccaceae bacterium]
MSDRTDDDRIAAVLADLALRRGRGKSFCPSEAARVLADDWRSLMPRVRRVAGEMQRRGDLQATRGGVAVDPEETGGPIRLGLSEP